MLADKEFVKKGILARILNINDNFTKWDKVVTIGQFGWSMLRFGAFVIATIWNLIALKVNQAVRKD